MRTKLYLIILMLLFGLVSSIHALSVVEEAKLAGSDGEAYDVFGWTVAISGDTAVIGANGADDLGDESGAAYIFQHSEIGWIETAKLAPSDGGSGDAFGSSVAISKNTAVIGAYADPFVVSKPGAAYIFRRSGSRWIEVAKLTASDGEAGDDFGWSAAISGDTVVIGARFDDDLGTNSGAAYIFQRSGRDWLEVAKLTAGDGEESDIFASSVAISKDIVVIGAQNDDDLGTNSGAAYIFRRSGSSWIEVAKLTASDGEAFDNFGNSVAIGGDTVVIGAQFDDDLDISSGAAYIFQRHGSSWIEVAKLTANDGMAMDQFGYSVSISGNTVVIGARFADDLGTGSGAAYVFQRSGRNWPEVAKLTASDGEADDWFGTSIANSGDAIVVGAFGANTNAGAAYIFKLR